MELKKKTKLRLTYLNSIQHFLTSIFLSNDKNRIRFRIKKKKKVNYSPTAQATTINGFLGVQMYSVHM